MRKIALTGTVSASNTPSAPLKSRTPTRSSTSMQVALDDGVAAAPEAPGLGPLRRHGADHKVVREAPSRAASRLQPLGYDRLCHVHVRAVVNVLAVRPLKVRDGRLGQRRDHERKFMAAIGSVAVKGTQEARSAVADPGLPGVLVEPDRGSPEVLRALEGLLEPLNAQVPSALKRAAEAELAVAESAAAARGPPRGSFAFPCPSRGAPDGRDPWALARGARNRRPPPRGA